MYLIVQRLECPSNAQSAANGEENAPRANEPASSESRRTRLGDMARQNSVTRGMTGAEEIAAPINREGSAMMTTTGCGQHRAVAWRGG